MIYVFFCSFDRYGNRALLVHNNQSRERKLEVKSQKLVWSIYGTCDACVLYTNIFQAYGSSHFYALR